MNKLSIYTGLFGIFCLVTSVALLLLPRDKIRISEGTYYYSDHPPSGYGFFARVSPTGGDVLKQNSEINKNIITAEGYGTLYKPDPKYRIVLRKGEFTNPDYPFNPVEIQAGESSAIIHIDLRDEDEEYTICSFYYSEDEEYFKLGSEATSKYALFRKQLNDRSEIYVDLDGDFIPDQRKTIYKDRTTFTEIISYKPSANQTGDDNSE